MSIQNNRSRQYTNTTQQLPNNSITTSQSSTLQQTQATSIVIESHRGTPCSRFKSKILRWKILGALFASLLVVGWIFIIVILIQEEKWQLVLVAWLLLYAAAHFCYWYFKRHHLLSLHSHICGRNRGAIGSVTPIEKNPDIPPSYDDILKSEPPPPEYYSVVIEQPKTSSSSSSSKPVTPRKLSKFTLQSLPKVFGRTSSTSSLSSPSCSGLPQNNQRMNQNNLYIGNKRFEKRIPVAISAQSISASIPENSLKWRSYANTPPPQYEEFEPDSQSRIINFNSISPSSRRRSSVSTLRPNSSISDEIHPIISPIYKAHKPYPTSRSQSSSSSSAVAHSSRVSQRRLSSSENIHEPPIGD